MWPKFSSLRVVAVFFLLSMVGCSKTGQLIDRLGSEDPNVKAKAIDSLVQMGEPAVIPLIEALSHKKAEIQKGAALALGKIRDKRAFEPLLAMLENANDSLAGTAALALGDLKDPRAVKPLSAKLWSSSIQGDVALALAKIGDPKSIGDLIGTIKKDTTCEKCFEALVEFGEAAAKALVQELWYEGIGTSSYHIDKDASASIVELAMYSPITDPIVAALVRIGEPAIEPLIAALQVEHSTIRGRAAMTLGIIRKDRAIEPLLRAIIKEYTNYSVGFASSYALGHETLALSTIGSPKAIKVLIHLMTDNVELVRSVAQSVIVVLRPRKAAVENLIASLSDKDPAVRRISAQTLVKLTGANIEPSQEKWMAWWQQNSERIAKEDQEAAKKEKGEGQN